MLQYTEKLMLPMMPSFSLNNNNSSNNNNNNEDDHHQQIADNGLNHVELTGNDTVNNNGTSTTSCQFQSSCLFSPTFVDKRLSDELSPSIGAPYQPMSTVVDQQQQQQQQQPQPNCSGCGGQILERYLLKVCNNLWHEHCLVCSFCGSQLGQSTSCYVREGKVFCKHDYKRLFGTKCARCIMPLNSSDLVHRSLNGVYHAACFTCVFCCQLLQPGDEYVLHEGQLVCRMDYESIMQNEYGPGFKLPSVSNDHRKSPKRPRTILTSQQRKAFKASFELSAKPCRKVREALAKETGLSVRVVQVWFQNQRAKMKKIQRKQEQNVHKQDGKANGEHHSSKKGADGNQEGSDSKGSKESKRRGSTSSTNSSDSSSELSCQSIGNETLDKTFDDESNQTPSTSMNPIDRLYSMQDSYFNF